MVAACPVYRDQTGPGPGRHLVRVCPNPEILARAVAEDFLQAVQATLQRHETAHVALAGGNTPRRAYTLLAQAPGVDWSRVHIYWTDERGVPANHPRSNYRMVWEALLAHIPIPETNIHRVPTEVGPEAAAQAYEALLAQLPRPLDWVLLGMGADGHTASLFPHTRALEEGQRRAVAVFLPGSGEWRVTLTYPVLNAAARVRVMVQGEAKAETLVRVLTGPYRPHDWPIQALAPSTPVVWWVDAAAAQLLPSD